MEQSMKFLRAALLLAWATQLTSLALMQPSQLISASHALRLCLLRRSSYLARRVPLWWHKGLAKHVASAIASGVAVNAATAKPSL
eukprot:2210188-Karenia_brevis.AAC.1